MILHHDPFSDKEIRTSMDEHGYDSLKPAITPEALKKECGNDPVLLQLYDQMTRQCKAYSHDVFSMMHEQRVIEEMRSRGENLEETMAELRHIDQIRHNSHESLMDSINILSRTLAKVDKDISWMREVSSGGRASYATFALLTFYSLNDNLN